MDRCKPRKHRSPAMIPYGRQTISCEDVEAVVAVLRSDFLTQGPAVETFETALRGRVNAGHCVAVSNATAALHIACLALDVGDGDIVWTSPITFVSSANCARLCGARVDFVDIDPDTFNMDVGALAAKLEKAKAGGTLPKVIIPVHMCGQSPDMAAIQQLANAFGVRIIEDASHGIGASYRGGPVGNCAHSDITVFSFHPVKIITTGEGGAATTNDDHLAQRLRELRSHGVTRDPARMENPPEGAWVYEQIDLGLNYRMTDFQAALGTSQLTRLDAFVDRRNELARRYDEALSHLPVRLPTRTAHARSSFHLYVIRLERAERRAAVFAAMRAAGILVNVHYIPVHLQPYYRALGFRVGDFPLSERYYEAAITLPLHPGLLDSEFDMIVATLERALEPG